MSIKNGNKFFKEKKYQNAIDEYNKIDKSSILYKLTKTNISMINNILNEKKIDTYQQVDINDKPLVSVVMPVFNVALYLDACILSVRNQSYTNLEIIIVNDASTDNGLDIIRMHESLDDRIIVIDLEYNTLGGAGIPSNIGMDKATGKYIAFADSDDILDGKAIEKMCTLAESTNSELVIADFCNFNDDDRKIQVAYDKSKWNGLPLHEAFSPKEYPDIFKLSPVPWRKLYKRDFLNNKKIRFPEGDCFFEDNPLHWVTISKAKNIALLDYVVAFHRMEREGQTMASGAYKLSALFIHINTIRKVIKNKPNSYIKEFIDFSMHTRWVVNRQSNEQLQSIFKKRLYQEIAKLGAPILKNNLKNNQKFNEFSNAYPDLDLTVVILNNNNLNLDKIFTSLDNIKTITFNVHIISNKNIEENEIFSIERKYDIINFNIYNNTNRIRNSIIPICSGRYSTFINSNFLINDTLEQDVNYMKSNKVDFLYNENILNEYDFNSYYSIIRTNYMRDLDIFFGPSNYSDLSFFWTSFLNTNKKESVIYDNSKINDKVSIDNYELILIEAKNILRNNHQNYVNKKDLRLFLTYIAELLSKSEDLLDFESWNNIFESEFKMLDEINNILCLKEK